MEPNNIENQIKEKLNSREIKPSEMAWDRLDAMLTIAEEKKTKRSFGWFFIAASILVLLSAGLFFYNLESSEIKTVETIVNNEANKDTVKSTINNEEIKKELLPNNKIQQLVSIEKIKLNNIKSQTKNHKPEIKNQEISTINQTITSQNQEIITEANPKKLDVDIQKDVVVNPETLLASVESLTKNESQKTATIKVNASSLLSQVDNELNQAYRDTKFEKIKKNFKTIKVALATRNQKQ